MTRGKEKAARWRRRNKKRPNPIPIPIPVIKSVDERAKKKPSALLIRDRREGKVRGRTIKQTRRRKTEKSRERKKKHLSPLITFLVGHEDDG